MTVLDPDVWISRPRPNPSAGLRLFCIPYAGGASQAFQSWPADLPQSIEVCAINLPGRGRRFTEPAFTDLLPLAQSLTPAIAKHADRPFALFGHSMGALIAFEVARRLRDSHRLQPAHLFVSGSHAPHFPDAHQYHKLNDADFVAKVRDLNGFSPEILANAEMMQLLLPSLRADFTLSETYVVSADAIAPLACPVSVFGGSDDVLVEIEKLDPWNRFTTGACRVEVFEGDHFFIRTHQREILGIVAERLRMRN